MGSHHALNKKLIFRNDDACARKKNVQLPWMNAATLFRIKGTPWLWEYAPMEPISADNSFARSRTSFGNALGARLANSGHSMRAATLDQRDRLGWMNNPSIQNYPHLSSEGDGRLI